MNANDVFVLQFTYLMGHYHGNRRMIAIWESPNPRGTKICSTRGFTHPDNYLQGEERGFVCAFWVKQYRQLCLNSRFLIQPSVRECVQSWNQALHLIEDFTMKSLTCWSEVMHSTVAQFNDMEVEAKFIWRTDGLTANRKGKNAPK